MSDGRARDGAQEPASPLARAGGAFGRLTLVAGLLATVFLVIAARLMWRQPLLADEVDFISAARDWPRLGWLIPHPPGYLYLIRVAFGLFGVSVSSARLVGVASAIVTVWLVPPFIRTCFPTSERRDVLAALAVAIFAVSPLAVQNMMLLDIDNTVLAPLLMAIAWMWFAGESWPAARRAVAMGIAIAAAAWFKFPPIVLLGAVLALTAVVRRRSSDLRVLLGAAALGVALFLITFRVHESLTGFGYAAMNTTFQKVAWLGDLKAMALRAPQTAGVLLMWLTFPQAALWLVGLRRTFDRSAAADPGPWFITIYSVIVAAFYVIALPPAWGYPKYDATLVPLLAILVAWVLVRAGTRSTRAALVFAAALLPALFLAQLGAIGDPLWEVYRQTFTTTVGQLSSRLYGAVAAFLPAALLTVAVVVAAVVFAAAKRAPRATTLQLALGAATIGMLAATTCRQIPASYSTRYRYTSRYADLAHASDRLRAALAPGEYIVATKELMFYTGHPGDYVQYYVWNTVPPDSILRLVGRRGVAAFAWTTKEENRSGNVLGDPRVDRMLHSGFTREQYGDFILWLSRARTPAGLVRAGVAEHAH